MMRHFARLVAAAIVFFTTALPSVESATGPGPWPTAPAAGQFFGNVTLVETYENATYKGFHALIKLSQPAGAGKLPVGTMIAVLSTSDRFHRSLLSALGTGFTVAVSGTLLNNAPTPAGGAWNYAPSGGIAGVYEPANVITYNSKM